MPEVAIINDQHLFSGTFMHAYKIYKNLREHNVTSNFHQFLISNDKPADKSIFMKYGILHNNFSKSKYAYNGKLALNFISGLNWRSFRDIEADVTVLSGPSLLPLVKYSRKTIVIGHDLYFLEGKHESIFLKSYMRRMYKKFRNADYVIVDSEFTRNDFLRKLKLDEQKVHVVYPYIDFKLFHSGVTDIRSSLKVDDKDVLILSVGGDGANKNIESVLKLLTKLPENYKLIRVGRNFNINRMINDLNLQKRVIALGNVETEILSELYRGCNFFIFPSLSEGFGIPLIEAMSSGIPIIASNRTSIPEVVGDSGVVCDPYDIESMFKAIIEISSDESLQKYYINKEKKRVLDFSKEKQFQSFSKVLKLALEKY
jgi:glycosyltransferase involved in cell wall biosynthesis